MLSFKFDWGTYNCDIMAQEPIYSKEEAEFIIHNKFIKKYYIILKFKKCPHTYVGSSPSLHSFPTFISMKPSLPTSPYIC